MGFLKLFSGKGPEEYEQKGDRFFKVGEYGAAKMEYETALDKAGKGQSGDAGRDDRLRKKVFGSREALALQHKQNAEHLRESGDHEGASELLDLALELTQDPKIAAELKQLLGRARNGITENDTGAPLPYTEEDTEEDREWHIEENEHFTALCGALAEETQEAYHGYGDAFRTGYVALNQGEYELAVTFLSQALEENPPDSLIPPELATAYLNLERYEEALALTERFLEHHPRSIQGYHTLCETLWADEQFDDARERILACPKEIAGMPPILHLKGESLGRSGRHQEAESFYRDLLESHGFDEHTAMSLAATYESLGKEEDALDLYSEIMRQCRGCGARINPFVKQRYADISLELGDHSAQILEIYLSLIDEDPAGRENHFRKVEQIYTAMGNEREARRYRLFANDLSGQPTD
ncbi:MAG: tetratricopeptide repeat protein [Syntrophales bacterium]|nr:tetratricopeptide repeat protein [Syntrophales bacterium]